MIKLYILDVGHGSCGVLVDETNPSDKSAILIDAGRGGTLAKFILAHRIKRIKAILLSHADEDHIGGLSGFLPSINMPLGTLYVNPDQTKDTDVWNDLWATVEKLETLDKNLNLEPRLNTETPTNLELGGIQIQIVWPSKYEMMGPRHLSTGRKRTSNSVSGVVRLVKDGDPLVLIAGDMDDEALTGIQKKGLAINARILLFPHHGGRPNDRIPSERFARELCTLVKPETVIFSIDRKKHKLPRPEIVQSIRNTDSNIRILCTQLSTHCADPLKNPSETHLTPDVAAGKRRHTCCTGTITVDLGAKDLSLLPDKGRHLEFVKATAPNALCISTTGQLDDKAKRSLSM